MIDQLDAPLRATWSFCGENGIMSEVVADVVAERLVEAGVFFVTLQDRPLAVATLPRILSTLSAGGCRNNLVCDGGGEDISSLVKELPIEIVFVDVRPFLQKGGALDGLSRAVARVRERGYEVGLLMPPLRSTLMMIPALLDFCRAERVGKFKLPNVSLFERGIRSQILTARDIEPFRALFSDNAAPATAGVTLEVHDLFLWEILTPGNDGSRSEYGGCQASNSLAHIDAEGNLYPCASWPELLGSLLDNSLADIWQAPRRFAVRDEIAAIPPGCTGCGIYPSCFGGCRGVSRFLADSSLMGRDPLCPSPRS